MMNDNMKKVLVALRSGTYKQTREALQDSSGYCCLGVMCDVYQKETGMTLELNADGNIYGGSLMDQEIVQEWVGLKDTTGRSQEESSLVDLNDDEGYTFEEIALFIESEPKGLLV